MLRGVRGCLGLLQGCKAYKGCTLDVFRNLKPPNPKLEKAYLPNFQKKTLAGSLNPKPLNPKPSKTPDKLNTPSNKRYELEDFGGCSGFGICSA